MTIQDLGPPRYDQLFGEGDFRRTLTVLGWTLTKLGEGGVPPGPTSRLRRLDPLLQSIGRDSALLATDSTLRRRLAEAQRTVFEFSGIANILPRDRSRLTKQVRKKLQQSYGGRDDPAEDGPRQVIARSTQFELWLAAYLAAGGKSVQSGEPDLLLDYQSKWQGIAAKRVRSRRQIVARIQAAAKQVRTRTGTGFVAVALDNYSDRDTSRDVSSDGATRGAAFFQEFPEIITATDWLQTHAPWIIGLISFGHVAHWELRSIPPSLAMDNLVHLVALGRSDTEVDYFNGYFTDHAETFTRNWQSFAGAT